MKKLKLTICLFIAIGIWLIINYVKEEKRESEIACDSGYERQKLGWYEELNYGGTWWCVLIKKNKE